MLDAVDRFIAWVKSWATKSGRREKKINEQIEQMKTNGTRIVVKRKKRKGAMHVEYILETKGKTSVHTQKISRTLAQFYVRR